MRLSPPRSRARLRALVAGLALLESGPAASAAVAGYEPTELEVKAAFLYHFAQLVTWPDAADAASTSPIVIAVLGPDPFGDRLEGTIGDENVRGRPIKINRVEKPADLSTAPHILFIGSNDASEVARDLAAVSKSPVLTVGVVKGFATQGGMIEFRLTPDSRVAFDINVGAVEAAGLKMSSQLLKIARIVERPR
jgi:YfiR/HmsC-like